MKLIEALKNLKTIEKRIDKNCQQIGEYAAYVSAEPPAFETEERQRQEVTSLVQGNLDLAKEYLRLKTAIEFTNLNTKVSIGQRDNTISELITIRRTSGKFVTMTHNALQATKALQKLQQFYQRNNGVNPLEPAKVIPLYSEADKNKALREWDEFYSAIDGKLEVVNAETELLNY
jgi:hypothetical protein